jgi:hypothetical protein
MALLKILAGLSVSIHVDQPLRLRPSPATSQAAHVRVHQALHIKPVWLRLLLGLLLITVLVNMHSSVQISEATEESRYDHASQLTLLIDVVRFLQLAYWDTAVGFLA